ENFDVLVSPTSPTVAFELGARTANPLAMYAADLLTIPSNLAGLPGLSIPCGLSDGLPVGLQLIGRQFAENLLFRAGHALERPLASRGGRCQDRARGRGRGPHPRRRELARRLQPSRHPAGRDRDGAGSPLGRAGQAVPAATPADRRRARDLGRGDGEGLPPV